VAGCNRHFLCCLLLLPPFAISRQWETLHSNQIFIINLLFGWTILGWIAALIWAVEKQKPPEPIMGPSIGGVPVSKAEK